VQYAGAVFLPGKGMPAAVLEFTEIDLLQHRLYDIVIFDQG
jgi:hypothetical protein